VGIKRERKRIGKAAGRDVKGLGRREEKEGRDKGKGRLPPPL